MPLVVPGKVSQCRIVHHVLTTDLDVIHLALRYGVCNEIREAGSLGGVGCETGVVIRALALGERRVRVVVHGDSACEEIHQRIVGRRKGRNRDTVGVRIGLVGGELFLHLREGIPQCGFLFLGDDIIGRHLPQAHLAVIDQLPVVFAGSLTLSFICVGDIQYRSERIPGTRGTKPHVVHLVRDGWGRGTIEYPGLGSGQTEGFTGFGNGCGAPAVRDAVPLIDPVLEYEFVTFVGHLAVGGDLPVVAVVDMSLALGVGSPFIRGIVIERRNIVAAPGDDRLVDLILQVGNDCLVDVVHDSL